MELNINDRVSHPIQGEGVIIKNFEDGELLIQFSDGQYTKPEASITLLEKAQKNNIEKIKKSRGWSPEKRQFYLEQYSWLKEVGPQSEPFGLKGKLRQAEYRKEQGLSFVDPVLSNLSLWGGILRDRGYVYQLADGRWAATEKEWQE